MRPLARVTKITGTWKRQLRPSARRNAAKCVYQTDEAKNLPWMQPVLGLLVSTKNILDSQSKKRELSSMLCFKKIFSLTAKAVKS